MWRSDTRNENDQLEDSGLIAHGWIWHCPFAIQLVHSLYSVSFYRNFKETSEPWYKSAEFFYVNHGDQRVIFNLKSS